MNRHERRRSLRRKIQNAIFKSTLVSHVILACILIPSILGLLVPIGKLMTRGVAFEIVQRYTMADTKKLHQPQVSASTLNKISEVSLIEQVIKKHMQKQAPSLTSEQLEELNLQMKALPTIIADTSSNDLKRLIWVGSEQLQTSNDFFDTQLSFLKPYTLDFKAKDYTFFIPDPSLRPHDNNHSIIESYMRNAETQLQIYDMSNQPIGYLTIGINHNIISMIVIPYLVMMLIVSFGSLMVVSLLGKFMTAGILKPVNSLNKQLKAMAEGDLDNFSSTPLSVKKAPIEITMMLDNANQILARMTSNKELLEAQNEELHSQNDELIETKEIIQKQQNLLVQNEKMASVGQLSAAIVHEINTPVGAIKSNAQMIQMLSDQLAKQELTESQLKPLEKIKTLNDIILQASDRVAAIIKSLKSYSRLDQSDFKASNVNEDLQNVLLLTSNLWKNRIQIVEQFGDLPLIKCYSGLLNQVFMNLVVNAIDAMEDGGNLTLNTSVRGECVVIDIQDTGTGIEADNLSRIFDEGFTTKSKNKGSGLGLALSKDIVEKHKGRIEVVTELGKGSTFSVFLPLNSDQT